MFWGKKKKGDKGLPDLPLQPRAIPSMRDFDKISSFSMDKNKSEIEEKMLHLPSFPASPMNKGFSQSAIKDAIETEESEEELPLLSDEKERQQQFALPEHKKSPIPPLQPVRKPKIIELEEWQPPRIPDTAFESVEEPPKRVIGNKPIFVRLDRFREAHESLDVIKEKLRDIEELLRTIREVKTKEDHELGSWEKEIDYIKARIESVNSEIFEKSYME